MQFCCLNHLLPCYQLSPDRIQVDITSLKVASQVSQIRYNYFQNEWNKYCTQQKAFKICDHSDASRARDTRSLVSFSTSPQFGIFGAFGRRCDPACLQNGGPPIVSQKSFNFIIMKAIFGRFFSEKCYFI